MQNKENVTENTIPTSEHLALEVLKQEQKKNNARIAQSLTPELIEKQKIEKWNGDVPTVQGNATPIISITE